MLAAGEDERVLARASRTVADAEGFLRRMQISTTIPTSSSHDELILKDGTILDRFRRHSNPPGAGNPWAGSGSFAT